MLRKVDPGKKKDGDGRLLQEIEALGQALYLNKNNPKGLVSGSDVRSTSAGKTHCPAPISKPRFVKEDPSQKDKKSSIWNWKPLKALSHIRNRRFNCCFSLQAHSIEGLPPSFNGTCLCVHWKRREVGLQTRPAKAFQGVVEFEETLTHMCSVYGSGNGPHHSAKYEAKYFLLYASMVGASDLDIGKHRVDLTRLLPLTLEELEDEKSSGKWTTSFKLSGRAKGAILNVSFGFLVLGDNPVESRRNRNAPELLNSKQNRPSTTKPVMSLDRGDGRSMLQRAGSLTGIPNKRSHAASQSVEDIKILHEVLPSSRLELASSVSSLQQRFYEEEMDTFTYSKTDFEVFSEDVEPLKPKACTFSESGKAESEKDCEDSDFTVIEQGIELSTESLMGLKEDTMKTVDGTAIETAKLDVISKGDSVALKEDMKLDPLDGASGDYGEGFSLVDGSLKENDIFTKESVMEELDSAFQSLSNFEPTEMNSSQDKSECTSPANHIEIKSNYEASKVGKSLSLDVAAESVASEFLSMLGIEQSPFGLSSDSDPESPRERLLRQFEKDALAGGNCIFDFDIGKVEAEINYDAPSGSGWGDHSEDFELSSVVKAAEAEHERAELAMKTKARAKMLEDLETEALMQEWGLNEKTFQCSPPDNAGGFGSPIDLPHGELLELPPIGEGLGPFIQAKGGGFLRSMSPSLFKSARNGGNLIMQVSNPIVVPAEMGSGIMEILQHLASVGIEKLSMQAKKLMPLEDITGKTMQQIAWESMPRLEAPEERQIFLQHEAEVGQDEFSRRRRDKGASSRRRPSNLNSSSLSLETGSEFVSLEDLAPLAMDKIEALSIEGLRIQSGMSDEDAPSNISPQAIGEVSALEGKRANITGSLGLEGAGGLQLLDVEDTGNDVDGLMGLSITLDEWMKLDAGIVDEEDQISERTSKILAAHHATSMDLACGGGKGDKRKGKGSGKRCGLLGNNFTVALMVQLRDPLRNYEPVGTPMLSLIQVERVFVPPKPKIYSSVFERRNNSEEDDEPEPVAKEDMNELKEEKKEEDEGIPQFKITEVHVAGLRAEPGKKKLWGNTTQQQSGSRWLLASGMGKNNKHPFMKSKAVAKSSSQVTTTVQPGDTLWSISSRVHGTGAKWKELAALNPHIRNPNVIFPNETIRLC